MVNITGELKERLLVTLADVDSQRIITAVHAESKTISMIEKELALPQSTLYRKISDLREGGLLLVDSFIVRPDGRREALYTRSFDEVRLSAEKAGIQLEIIESAKSLEKRWFELFFSKRVFSSTEQPPSAGS